MIDDPAETLTTREAAEKLGVSLRTVQLWVEGDILPAWKTPGGHRRIPKHAVDVLVIGQPLARPADRAPTAPPDVLIVEDDAIQRRLLQVLVRKTCPRVTIRVARDGYEGLVRAGQQVPDLIITDILMPGMNGLRMLASLRAMPEFSNTRIIVVSGLDLAEIEQRGGISEKMAYLMKPVNRAEWLAALRQVMPDELEKPAGSLPTPGQETPT